MIDPTSSLPPAWQRIARALFWLLVLGVLAITGLVQLAALIQPQPEGRAVALGYLGSGATVLAAFAARPLLRRFGQPERPGAGLRFMLIGSLGALWVETLFWITEKLTGAAGIAASPNLIVDLLVTMPWYVAMVAVLWLVYRRFRYHWATIALLGGLYEIGADGIVGHVLGGEALTPGYLALLVLLYSGVFVVVYAPIVLPPVWAVPLSHDPEPRPRWQRALGTLLPLLPLLPYWLVVQVLLG